MPRLMTEPSAGASGRPPADEAIVSMVEHSLNLAVERRASDIHFEPQEDGLLVRYRIDGLLCDVDRWPAALAQNVVARLKVLAGLLTYRIDVPQEGAFQFPGPAMRPLDVRVATFPTIRGERAVVRLLHHVGQVNGLNELGLAADTVDCLATAARCPHGLILVTGPAGSGKSTTLYALAREILATTPGRSVVSLEDPVEQRVESLAQIQIAPHGELDYVTAMRSLLRQDVQVLLVGEIRDAATAHIVVDAALTGHLIMSTLHSGDPAETLSRLLEMGIEPYQVSGAVTLVCSQRLVRTVCGACRPTANEECEDCAGTRYRGRTACGQVVTMNDALRDAVLRHAPVGELRRVVGTSGRDLASDAMRLVEMGMTTREEVLRVLGTTQSAT